MCNNGLPGQALIAVRYVTRWIIINGACSRPLLLGQPDQESDLSCPGRTGPQARYEYRTVVVRHTKVSPASHDTTVRYSTVRFKSGGLPYSRGMVATTYSREGRRLSHYSNRRVQYRTVPTVPLTVLSRLCVWVLSSGP